jgi:hypothetical protein
MYTFDYNYDIISFALKNYSFDPFVLCLSAHKFAGSEFVLKITRINYINKKIFHINKLTEHKGITNSKTKYKNQSSLYHFSSFLV